ncbi:signal peptidase I [Rickettsiales endosymbiont of Stachyamoeba lipophora]|uniref:signal peptidase I n=1 Tax=Rickettsiales endosymbiont of Stachyamoeba lipophora TaxID=2486578 RepID=UPI000F64E7B8|nr:signal peptidase I [Rickettsiales endosymbiont of Stachyamoeba lipophora]AZL16427.1 signal peptidase I [Rickettsiales endosymbiont of Stachyamoeba lipophora]
MSFKIARVKKVIIENIKSLGAAVIFAILIRSFIVEPFQIPSSSMKPNLLIGDFLFVSKYSYGFSRHSFPFSIVPIKGRIFNFNQPERGDVIVFRGVENPNKFYIKRLIGLAGDKVQMINGVLYINNQPVNKIYAGTFSDNEFQNVKMYNEELSTKKIHLTLDLEEQGILDNTKVYEVPEGYLFMMGDNRDGSNDSRWELGYIPYENIIGRAEFIFFSIDGKFLEFWKWYDSIRFSRIFNKVN